jgi:hypothetical protein
VDKYEPDVLYFDTNELPLGQAGLDVVAHYYNLSAARNGGKAEVVVNGKHILAEHMSARSSRTSSEAPPTPFAPNPGRPIPASATGITAAPSTRRIATRPFLASSPCLPTS